MNSARERIARLLIGSLGLYLSSACVESSSTDVARECVDCAFFPDCGNGSCAPGEVQQWILDAEIRPSPESPFVETQRTFVRLGTDRVEVLTLSTAVPYDTWVLDAGGRPVDADLSFEPSNPIAERPLALTHRARASRPARVPLPPGTYSIRIAPLDPELPAVDIEDFVVAPGPGLRLKELFLPERFRRLRGLVRSRISTAELIEGVHVTAVGVESGLSSTTDISNEDGEYEIALPESADTVFRVRARLPELFQPSWEYEEVIRVPAGEDRLKSIELDIPSEAVRGSATVEVLGLDSRDVQPIPDARVTLTASVTDDIEGRVYLVSGRTNSDGQLVIDGDPNIPLLRGRYDVVVTPPASSLFARIEQGLVVDTIGNGVSASIQLVADRRPRLRGEIAGPGGSPVPFAEVSLTAIDGTLRGFSGVSDDVGAFDISVDPGSYLMVIAPRFSAETFARSARRIEVPRGLPNVRMDTVRLEAPLPVLARLQDADGGPVPDVEVTLFGETAGVRYVLSRARSGPNGDVLFALFPEL